MNLEQISTLICLYIKIYNWLSVYQSIICLLYAGLVKYVLNRNAFLSINVR